MEGLNSFALVNGVVALASAEVDVSGLEATSEINSVTARINAFAVLEGIVALSGLGVVEPKGSSSVNLIGVQGSTQIKGVLVWGRVVPDNPTNWIDLDPTPDEI